jgi:uncharacterized protein YndB with AHSA1/START domain
VSGKRFHVARTIAAPADRVWALLTDAAGYCDWNKAVVSIEGTIALGNTIKVVSVVNPKRTFSLKVTEMVAPSRMVWSDGMPLGLFTGKRTYTLAERDGATEFTMTEEFTGLLSGLITKAIPDMTDSFNQFADGLKSAAERLS